MPDAELRNEGVNRSHLNSCPATVVPQRSSFDMILPVRRYKGNMPEAFNDGVRCLGSRKTLQQFLQNETGRRYGLPTFQRPPQPRDFRNVRHGISAQGQRPYAGINKQRHERERSAL